MMTKLFWLKYYPLEPVLEVVGLVLKLDFALVVLMAAFSVLCCACHEAGAVSLVFAITASGCFMMLVYMIGIWRKYTRHYQMCDEGDLLALLFRYGSARGSFLKSTIIWLAASGAIMLIYLSEGETLPALFASFFFSLARIAFAFCPIILGAVGMMGLNRAVRDLTTLPEKANDAQFEMRELEMGSLSPVCTRLNRAHSSFLNFQFDEAHIIDHSTKLESFARESINCSRKESLLEKYSNLS